MLNVIYKKLVVVVAVNYVSDPRNLLANRLFIHISLRHLFLMPKCLFDLRIKQV